MRRTTLALGAVLLVGASATLPADAFRTEEAAVPWSLATISPSGRYLRVVANGGGCSRPLVVSARETADAVELTVLMPYAVPESLGEACTSDLRRESGGVLLAQPLAGRRLVGQWRGTFFLSAATAPRMLGARGGDALRALANARITGRLVGPVDGRVVRQKPAAGQPAPRGVTLVTR